MSELDYFTIEATLGGIWINLNEPGSFKPATDPNLAGTSKTKRRITTTSPVLDGDYLIHATAGQITEQLKIWVYGDDHTDLANNYQLLEQIFDQFDFRVRITMDNFREVWTCQASDYTLDRSQTMTHNCMAIFTASIPRFPSVYREEII